MSNLSPTPPLGGEGTPAKNPPQPDATTSERAEAYQLGHKHGMRAGRIDSLFKIRLPLSPEDRFVHLLIGVVIGVMGTGLCWVALDAFKRAWA